MYHVPTDIKQSFFLKSQCMAVFIGRFKSLHGIKLCYFILLLNCVFFNITQGDEVSLE